MRSAFTAYSQWQRIELGNARELVPFSRPVLAARVRAMHEDAARHWKSVACLAGCYSSDACGEGASMSTSEPGYPSQLRNNSPQWVGLAMKGSLISACSFAICESFPTTESSSAAAPGRSAAAGTYPRPDCARILPALVAPNLVEAASALSCIGQGAKIWGGIDVSVDRLPLFRAIRSFELNLRLCRCLEFRKRNSCASDGARNLPGNPSLVWIRREFCQALFSKPRKHRANSKFAKMSLRVANGTAGWARTTDLRSHNPTL